MKEQEFGEWKHNPETKRFFKYLENKLDEIKTLWVSGHFTREDSSGTLQLNAEALAKAAIIQEILSLEADYDE